MSNRLVIALAVCGAIVSTSSGKAQSAGGELRSLPE
jgi:hypothetical protein